MDTGKWVLGGLLALNLGLAGALWRRSGPDTAAWAQVGGGRGSNYLVTAGHANNLGAIFIFDTRTGMLAVGELDHQKGTFMRKWVENVDSDFQRAAGGGGR